MRQRTTLKYIFKVTENQLTIVLVFYHLHRPFDTDQYCAVRNGKRQLCRPIGGFQRTEMLSFPFSKSNRREKGSRSGLFCQSEALETVTSFSQRFLFVGQLGRRFALIQETSFNPPFESFFVSGAVLSLGSSPGSSFTRVSTPSGPRDTPHAGSFASVRDASVAAVRKRRANSP